MEALEKESREQLRGFSGARDQDLFTLDAEPPVPSTSRPSKKELARSRPTRAQAILGAINSGKAFPTGPAPKTRAIKLPEVGGRRRTSEAKAKEDLSDPWAAPVPKAASRKQAPRPRISAVEVDMPGCSYHPDAVSHEDAVARAVAKEMAQQLRKELEPVAPPQLLDVLEPDGLLLDGEQQEEEEEAESDGEDGVTKRPAAGQKTKTKADRNKEASCCPAAAFRLGVEAWARPCCCGSGGHREYQGEAIWPR